MKRASIVTCVTNSVASLRPPSPSPAVFNTAVTNSGCLSSPSPAYPRLICHSCDKHWPENMCCVVCFTKKGKRTRFYVFACFRFFVLFSVCLFGVSRGTVLNALLKTTNLFDGRISKARFLYMVQLFDVLRPHCEYFCLSLCRWGSCEFCTRNAKKILA